MSVLAENLSAAINTLRDRKVRSALTILGVVIGVTSVIAVASIIDGLNGVIRERVEKLGSRTLFVTRIPPATDRNRLSQRIRMRKYLQDDDAPFIEESCPAVAYATTFVQRITLSGDADSIR